jgi:hypothetical protein
LPFTVCRRRSGKRCIHLTRFSKSMDALAASLFN